MVTGQIVGYHGNIEWKATGIGELLRMKTEQRDAYVNRIVITRPEWAARTLYRFTIINNKDNTLFAFGDKPTRWEAMDQAQKYINWPVQDNAFHSVASVVPSVINEAALILK